MALLVTVTSARSKSLTLEGLNLQIRRMRKDNKDLESKLTKSAVSFPS